MRNINPFGLRLQPELKARLEEAAKQNKRSLNAEIAARLESTFSDVSDGPQKLTVKIDKQKLATNSGIAGKAEQQTDLSYDELEDLLRDIITSSIDAALGKPEKRSAKPSKGPVNLGVKYDPHPKVMTKVTRAETIKPASKRITRTRKKPAE
ncbi:Arc family DNA-binding protein [Stutzerimonas stutzeri]|nr:Arc family DNA-binding protein [Stutzerimonas stutzeri]